MEKVDCLVIYCFYFEKGVDYLFSLDMYIIIREDLFEVLLHYAYTQIEAHSQIKCEEVKW
jgi:hypothetical protein